MVDTTTDNRHQWVALNSQSSKWSLVEIVVPQGSVLCRQLLLVCIIDLPQGLRCNAELFADDTSLSSTVTSPVTSSSSFNEDLIKITQ